MGEPFLQQGPIGQPCELVVEGEGLDLILVLLLLGDVPQVYGNAPVLGENADVVPAFEAGHEQLEGPLLLGRHGFGIGLRWADQLGIKVHEGTAK